jgi:hypothetical protein
MEIKTYITDVLNNGLHATGFPAHLDIPKSFVDRCYTLYSSGEARHIELGLTLSSAADGTLQISAIEIDGDAGGTGINLPVTAAITDIGDLHCHPSSSIGHKDGYAAHSPEDVASMQHHAAKPLFLRFVCSGTMIYLMAFRSGLSAISNNQIFAVRDANHDLAGAYFDRLCPYDVDTRNDMMLALPTQAAINQEMRRIRRVTPGLGREMQRLSIAGGIQIANSCHLGFYKADQGWGISVAYYGYLRLYLQ